MEDHIWPETALELTETIRGSAEWQAALEIVREVNATGKSMQEGVDAIVEVLSPHINIDEHIDRAVEQGLALNDDARRAVRRYFTYQLAASVVAETEGAKRPLLPMMAGGVQVTFQEVEGLKVPTVIAVASPLTPGSTVRDFEAACDRVFGSMVSDNPDAVRNAEWYRRHEAGERWVDIALSDRRSGISPEAMANPKDYPEDKRRAADVVRRGAQRYEKKWTEVVDRLSANPK